MRFFLKPFVCDKGEKGFPGTPGYDGLKVRNPILEVHPVTLNIKFIFYFLFISIMILVHVRVTKEKKDHQDM